MIDRYLKALTSAIVGLMATLYVAHNLVNADKAYAFFAYTASHADQEVYPITLLPVLPPFMVVAAMVLVFGLEIAAGVFCLLGGWTLWRARGADKAGFAAAKRWTKIGCGCALANWWGLFQGVAVAGYQLWQKPLGESPFYGSFFFGAIAMTVLIYVSMTEGESAG